jgi:hypothetical protein
MFLCVTYSGTTLVPYVNGTRLQAIQNKTQDRQDDLMYNLSLFGHQDNVNDFARCGYGDIAEIGIYNTALNDTEISNLSLSLPNEDFGRMNKRGNLDFRSTFQGREYSVWDTNQ